MVVNPHKLVNGFLDQLKRYPAKPAFVLDSNSLTYRQLAILADDITKSLNIEESWHRPDQRPIVGWCAPNRFEFAALYIALLRADCILALMDPGWPSVLRDRLVSQFGIDFVLSTDTDEGDLRVASTNTAGQVSPLFRYETEDQLFLLGFTSGSTADPKAFVRSQRSWCATFEHAAREFDLSASDVVLAPGPLSHGLSFYAMAETLNFGGTFYGMVRFNAKDCLRIVAAFGISTLVVVPTMLVAIIEAVEQEPELVESIQNTAGPSRIISAGAKLNQSVRQSLQSLFPDAEITEYYGASELSFVSVSHQHEHQPAQSVGRAFSGTEVSIRDEGGAPVETGKTGLIYVKSSMLAEGYVDPNAPNGVLSLNGTSDWKTVGDIGYMDEQRTLFLTDRTNNMLITGGLNVYPSEIEDTLQGHQQVQECVVLGLRDQYWGDRVIAVVRQQRGTSPTDRSLREFCEKRLAGEKVPRNFYLCDVWPMTSSGKINRRSLLSSLENNDGDLIELTREQSARGE